MFSESHFYFTVKEIATQSANACFPTLQDKAKHAVRQEIFLLQVRNRNLKLGSLKWESGYNLNKTRPSHDIWMFVFRIGIEAAVPITLLIASAGKLKHKPLHERNHETLLVTRNILFYNNITLMW